MQKRMARLVLPAVFAALGCVPAFAQIRVGVELPSIHIRIAPDAPPPLRHEIRLARPGPNDVWIGGYWDRQDDRWAWAGVPTGKQLTEDELAQAWAEVAQRRRELAEWYARPGEPLRRSVQ